jgi:hypothetical protein
MDAYMTNYESRTCVCGGRCNAVPSIKTRHEETTKHRSWRWRTLCEAMLSEGLTSSRKRDPLRELRTLVSVA